MSTRPLKLISSMAARELLRELSDQYQSATGETVVTEAAGGVDVAKRVSGGETADVVVLSDTAIDKLVAEGKVLAGSRTDLVKSGVAIAVKSGAPRPDIDSEEAVKQAVMAAKTLSFSTGPSGVYLEKLFARWGILESVKPRIVVPPPGIPVGTLVARGEAELGFQQLSELMNLEGITVLGPLPPAIQTLTIFAGGIVANSSDAARARALLDFMNTPATAAIKQRQGMEPAA
jgi:molybdate transport system substrate-binding protein